MSKTDASGTHAFVTDGSDVASAVLSDGAAVYTPGLSERRSGASKFYHTDALGSTRGITNSSQTATDSILYDAFGMTVSRTGTTPTPFGFVGKADYQTDSDTGLMLLGHRYYDPSIGRFITQDPIGDGDNWYEYCDNNPLLGTDPQGLQDVTAAGGVGPGSSGGTVNRWIPITGGAPPTGKIYAGGGKFGGGGGTVNTIYYDPVKGPFPPGSTFPPVVPTTGGGHGEKQSPLKILFDPTGAGTQTATNTLGSIGATAVLAAGGAGLTWWYNQRKKHPPVGKPKPVGAPISGPGSGSGGFNLGIGTVGPGGITVGRFQVTGPYKMPGE